MVAYSNFCSGMYTVLDDAPDLANGATGKTFMMVNMAKLVRTRCLPCIEALLRQIGPVTGFFGLSRVASYGSVCRWTVSLRCNGKETGLAQSTTLSASVGCPSC